MHNRRIITAIVYGALLAGTMATAGATTLLRMSLSRLSQTAQVIVRARCVGSAASWDAGEIWTFLSFDAEEVWKGSPPARFTVRMLGGQVGNLTSSVSGVPRFSVGADVVLFLEPTPQGDFTIVGWQQGTFRVLRDFRTGEESVTQDSAAFATFDPVARQFRVEGIRKMPLTEFRDRVADSLSGESRSKP
jgi:hypothetical protein